MSYCLLYVTHRSSDEATLLAQQLLTQKLIACANIYPGVRSLYEWEGKVQSETEVVLVLKTTAALAAEAQAEVVRSHPYDCPCVLQLPIEAGHAAFLEFIDKQTKS